MASRVYVISWTADLNLWVERIGADPATKSIFQEKDSRYRILITDVPPHVANIIKQEMLSAGGDAIVNKHVINCKVKATDVLVLGTLRQIRTLKTKLEKMPYWNLPKLGSEILQATENLSNTPQPIKLPHGILTFDTPHIMGIINVTPDSFFSGSRRESVSDAIRTARAMIEAGATILDIGGESTRPGAEPVPPDEELKRVIPVIEAIRKEFPKVIISVDTYKAKVASAAIEAGADIVNDISGLSFDPDMPKAVADAGVGVVIMHIKGTPKNMQLNPSYENFTKEVMEFLLKQMEVAISSGIKENKIILDPGIGFGKRLCDNLEIFHLIPSIRSLGRPVLIGASRKSMIGILTEKKTPDQRLAGTLATTAIAIMLGANIIRVHDVAENADAAIVANAIRKYAEFLPK